MKKIITTLIPLLTAFIVAAQENAADTRESSGLRADGKIYVVVAVLLTILAGFIFYVIRLDRKIKKLEEKGK